MSIQIASRRITRAFTLYVSTTVLESLSYWFDALIIFFETFLFDREVLITSLAIIGIGSLRLVPLLNSVNLGLNQLRGASDID